MTRSFRTISITADAVAFLASALAYPFLPERVATHFDDAGRPDRYGSRAAAALTLPAIMAALAAFGARLAMWPGRRDREDRESGARALHEAVSFVQLGLLSGHLAALANGLGLRFNMSRVLRGIYGVLMISLGNVIPKLPRNGLVGIRTPWTLADPTVWERTHRLAGYLITAAGVVDLLSLPVKGKRAARLPTATLLGAIGASSVYSLIAYARRDRTRRNS